MKKHKVLWSYVCRKCILLMVLWLFGSLSMSADDAKWLLVTNDGTKIEMDLVGSFVLSDQSDAFDVLNKEGNVLAAKVKKATFEYYDSSTDIKSLNVAKQSSLLSYSVDKQLTIIGAANEAQVFSSAGALVTSARSKAGTITIDVSHLPQGVYMVRTGKQTFKFTKK